jgi:DNA-directed RNA polymerase subunit N (RpoN/RPB10)
MAYPIQCYSCGQNIGELYVAFQLMQHYKRIKTLASTNIDPRNMNSICVMEPDGAILTNLGVHTECSRMMMLTHYDPKEAISQTAGITPTTPY